MLKSCDEDQEEERTRLLTFAKNWQITLGFFSTIEYGPDYPTSDFKASERRRLLEAADESGHVISCNSCGNEWRAAMSWETAQQFPKSLILKEIYACQSCGGEFLKLFESPFDLRKSRETTIPAGSKESEHGSEDESKMLLKDMSGNSQLDASEILHQKLIAATSGGQYESVKELIKQAVNLHNSDYFFDAPFYLAVENNHADIVTLLLESDAILQATETRIVVHNALDLAVSRGFLDIVRIFLDHGTDPNRTGFSASSEAPLHQAASHGHSKIVELLLEKGASIDARTYVGLTPLDIAQEQGHTQVVEILRAASARTRAESPIQKLDLLRDTGTGDMCSLCGQKFSQGPDQSRNYVLHLRAEHQEHKFFECPVKACENIYTTSFACKLHVAERHLDTRKRTSSAKPHPYESWGEEITTVGDKFSKASEVIFDEIDVQRRRIVLSLTGPWGTDDLSININVTITFPSGYPNKAKPIVLIKQTQSFRNGALKRIHDGIDILTSVFLSQERRSFEAILRYLLGEESLAEEPRASISYRASEEEEEEDRFTTRSARKLSQEQSGKDSVVPSIQDLNIQSSVPASLTESNRPMVQDKSGHS